MSKRLFFACLLFSFVAGCARVTPDAPAPLPGAAQRAVKAQYVIGPGDALHIDVYGQQDLSRDYTVSAEGNLALPLAGQVHAAGLSVVQIEQLVRQRFAEYLVNPQVSVSVQQFRQRFSVLGEVRKPGAYPLQKPTTVLEAISVAGGFTEKAAPNRTRVIRSSGGHESTIEVSAGDIMEGGDQSADILLKPDDKVVVPESFF